MLPNCWHNSYSILSGILLTIFISDNLYAESNTQNQSKKTTTQQVGGLLFDVDEGVKIEKGSGGSIYVKSNKEFMQEKFASIDERLTGLESRVEELEKKDKAKKKAADSSLGESNRVLVS